MSHKRLDLRSQRLEESDCTDHISHVLPQSAQSSSGSSVLCVCDHTLFLRPPLLLASVTFMPINAIEFLQTSWFVHEKSHDIVCYVLTCHGRPDDVMTQPVGCRPYPRGGNLNRSKTTPVPTNERNTRNGKFHLPKTMVAQCHINSKRKQMHTSRRHTTGTTFLTTQCTAQTPKQLNNANLSHLVVKQRLSVTASLSP